MKVNMKNRIKLSAMLVSGVLLVACGGGDSGQSAPAPKFAASIQASVGQLAITDYHPVVQQLYISYFGRPADVSGLQNFSLQLSQLNASSDLQGLTADYEKNTAIRALIDSFGSSDESKALYSGDNGTFIAAIYQNVLGRAPDAEGKAFWVNAISSGQLTRANASLALTAGALVNVSAQGLLDGKLVRNRQQLGSAFTAGLDTPAKSAAYSGNAAAAAARAMLSSISAESSSNGFQAIVSATIGQLAGTPVPTVPSFAEIRSVIIMRCVACHSVGSASGGVLLASEASIRANASAIHRVAGASEAMPLGNITGMTEAEREMIRVWFAAGAK
jgi:hypothetical protein